MTQLYTSLYVQRYVYLVDPTEVEKELNLIVEKLKVSKAETIELLRYS